MKTTTPLLLAVCLLAATGLRAEVPQLLSYQGRVSIGGVNFTGAGQFKFALVDAAGTTTYWSNDGTSVAGGQPTASVNVTVSGGLYAVLLGDTSLANMTAVNPAVFANAQVKLRVWFNDGTNGFQLLSPDQRLAAVGYALMAADVADGSITAAKLAAGSVGANTLTNTSVTPGTYELATIAVDAQGRVTSATSNSTVLTRVTSLESDVADLAADNSSFVTQAALAIHARTDGDNAFTGINTFTDARGQFTGRVQLTNSVPAEGHVNPHPTGTLSYDDTTKQISYFTGDIWQPLFIPVIRHTSASVSPGGSLTLVATDKPGSAPPVVTLWTPDIADTVREVTADRNASGDPAYSITYNWTTRVVTVTNNSGVHRSLHLRVIEH